MNLMTYSFQDVQAAISGGGGQFSLGYGSGNAEEGITAAMSDSKGIGTVGADGKIMPTLRASKLGKVTVRLLKTSPVNAQLSRLYNAQSINTAFWATNTITAGNVSIGDVISLTGAWFVKQPDIVYAKDGNMNDWEFEGNLDMILGAGQPLQ